MMRFKWNHASKRGHLILSIVLMWRPSRWIPIMSLYVVVASVYSVNFNHVVTIYYMHKSIFVSLTSKSDHLCLTDFPLQPPDRHHYHNLHHHFNSICIYHSHFLSFCRQMALQTNIVCCLDPTLTVFLYLFGKGVLVYIIRFVSTKSKTADWLADEG